MDINALPRLRKLVCWFLLLMCGCTTAAPVPFWDYDVAQPDVWAHFERPDAQDVGNPADVTSSAAD